MKKLFLELSFAALCAALLSACGSESGTNGEPLENSSNSSSESFNEYDSIVEEVGNLPKCTEGKDGEVYYVKEAGVAYTCRYDEDEEAGEWINASEGSDGSSSFDVVTGTLTDSRDGQTYRTVKIGDQVWMAENLNYETDNSWCFVADPANCAKYGRLYTWAAAMDSVGEWSTNGKGCGYGKECSVTSPVRGICPEGWHLPSRAEWDALIVAVDGSITEYMSSNTAGTKLKSQTGWYSNGNGTDAFGFSALPAGYRDNNGSYFNEGNLAYFWSSSEYGSFNAYNVSLYYNDVYAFLFNYDKLDGFSVRCLED